MSIHSENFDSGLSLPSGWTWGSGFSVTNAPPGGITPTSTPNCLELAATGLSAAQFGVYNTADTNGGDVLVRWNFNADADTNILSFGCIARANSPSIGASAGTYYEFLLDVDNGIVYLRKVVSGVLATLGSLSAVLAVPTWYQATLTCVGSSISGTVKRLSDGYYLDGSGAFVSGSATALTATDSSITGAGLYGLAVAAKGNNALADDLLVDIPTASTAATLSRTDGADTGTASGTFVTRASLGSADRADTASLAGGSASASHASTGATERPDAGSATGTDMVASAAIAEARDAASMPGNAGGSILTVQDGADTPSFVGVSTAPASLSAADARDTPTIFGVQRSGSIAVTDGTDHPALTAAFVSVASAAAQEGRDSAGLAGHVQNGPVLAAVERGDVGSATATVQSGTFVRATDGRDTGAFVGHLSGTTALAAIEAGDRGAILGVALGIPPAIAIREAGDVGHLYGGSPALWYNIYDSGPIDAPVDYTSRIDTTSATTWVGLPGSTATVSVPSSGPFPPAAFPSAAFPPAAFPGAGKATATETLAEKTTLSPGTWRFAVRAANQYGEEQNLDCMVEVILDADGNDITNRPLPPVGLRAIAIPNGSIRVEWSGQFLGPAAKAPTSYLVYMTPGTVPSYGEPAATVPASSGLFGIFSAVLAGGLDEQTYAIAVRASNAWGVEPNTQFVTVEAEVSGPPVPVAALTATPVV